MQLREIEIKRFKGIDDVRLQGLSRINALYGKNNSGKSTILHALEMAGLALSTRTWNWFQPKLEIRDLFQDAGPFEVLLTYEDGSRLTIRQGESSFSPVFQPEPTEEQRFRSIYIVPDPGLGLVRRRHVTPKSVREYMEHRTFSDITGLDILYAVKFYSQRRMRGLQPEDYKSIIDGVKEFFPEIEELTSDRTEDDVATVTYTEYGRSLDLVYAGSGLKHLIDIFVKAAIMQASVVLIDEPEMGMHPALQRALIKYLGRLAEERHMQFFFATHSPVFLSEPERISVLRVQNRNGKRSVTPVSRETLYTAWGDLGLRPSDMLQNDIVVLVEGSTDVILFEHILHNLYQAEFRGVAVGVVQYAGAAAEQVIDGTITVENISPGDTYKLWIKDRDACPDQRPSSTTTKFCNALCKQGQEVHILRKREIEYYIPEAVYVHAQDGDASKVTAIKNILNGHQSAKLRKLAKAHCCTIPRGENLRKLLAKHLTRHNLDPELKQIVEQRLIPWRDEILGV